MSSTTVNLTVVCEWTDNGQGRDLIEKWSYTSVTKTKRQALQGVDNSGWFLVYDASQTTTPPIGNDDPADAPFNLIIVSKSEDTIVRFTDSVGGIFYMTVPAGKTAIISGPVFGSTENAARLEQIDVKSASATVLTGEVLIQHD